MVHLGDPTPQGSQAAILCEALFENTGVERRQGFQDVRVYGPLSGTLNNPYGWAGEAATEKAADCQSALQIYRQLLTHRDASVWHPEAPHPFFTENQGWLK